MEKDKQNGHFSKRRFTIVFVTIVCVSVVLLVGLLISGLFAIAYEKELYAKELDNPYVNSDFEGWHTEVTDYGKIILPQDWLLTTETQVLQIMQDGESIAAGALVSGKETAFSSKEAFLSQVLKTDVTKVHCDNLHSLLSSSFGKLYINDNEEFQGYYLSLGNKDGSSLFFCFSSTLLEEKELRTIAEAIIFDHKFG